MAETALARRTRENDQRVAEARAKLPESTAHLDNVRKWAPDAKLTFAQEGRNRFGEPGPEGVVPVLQMRKPEKLGKAEEAIAEMKQRALI